jgi:uncharacterized membrane protein YdjX (TVP38/TMEM64 family)
VKKTGSRGPAWGKIIAIAILLAALGAVWRYTPVSEYITAQRVSGWARAVRHQPWAPALVVFAYAPASLVMFPRPLLTLFTVIAFGPWFGFLYSMLGVMVAALATYYAGRALPEKTVARITGDHLQDMSKRLRNHGFVAVLALRLAPVTPFPADSMICGALRIGVVDYSLGTFLGMVPGVLATTVFGKHIAAALEDPSRINYWVLGAIVLVFIALTWSAGRWFAKQQA